MTDQMRGSDPVPHTTEDLPAGQSAVVHMLQDGYSLSKVDHSYEREGDAHIAPSIGLVIDGDAVIVVDPGFVADRAALIAKVLDADVDVGDVTDIVLSHHHPDHTVNAALFPNARIHDHWAVYTDDVWHSREADQSSVSPSVSLLRTPGHTPEDITTLVRTSSEVYAFTHAWATKDVPDDQQGTPDTTFLRASRRRILRSATIIVPGHAAPFRV